MFELEKPKNIKKLIFEARGNERTKTKFSRMSDLFTHLAVSQQMTAEKRWDCHDVNSLSLEEFIELYESERNQLAYRKLLGERLSQTEQIILTFLNHRLEQLLVETPPKGYTEFLDALSIVKNLARK